MSLIDKTVTISAIRGIDYAVSVGLNELERRVLVIRMRLTGEERYHPVIEMDVDIPSFYRDTLSGFDFQREDPPVPE